MSARVRQIETPECWLKGVWMKKRIVIVDDHVSIRDMLTAVIGRNPAYEVVGQAGSGLAAISTCMSKRPDLVILDLVLPELSGLEVMRRLRAELSPPRMLIFSGTMCEKTIVDALRCRPDGFVGKSETLVSLFEGIKAVLAGCR